MSVTYDAAVKRYEQMSYKDLAAEFKRLKDDQARVKAEAAELANQFDALTLKVLPDKLMEDGFKNINIDGIGRIEMRASAWVKTLDAERLKEWLVGMDAEDLIKPTVNASTLRAFLKERQELGDDLPPEEVVQYDPYLRATVVKG